MTKVRAEAVLKDEANSKAPAISVENMIFLDECSFHFFTFLLGLESDELWIVFINKHSQNADLIQQLAHLKLLDTMALQLPPVQPRNGLQKSPHWEAVMTT